MMLRRGEKKVFIDKNNILAWIVHVIVLCVARLGDISWHMIAVSAGHNNFLSTQFEYYVKMEQIEIYHVVHINDK